AGRRCDPARLAACRRQQPEGRLGLIGSAVLLGTWLRALGDEDQRAVGQELRRRLALGRPGEPSGWSTGRVDAPDAGAELAGFWPDGLHGGGKPAAVRRQAERSHCGNRYVFGQVAEPGHWGLLCRAGGTL